MSTKPAANDPSKGLSIQKTFSKHFEPITAIGWSPDGRFLASGSVDETVKIWDADEGRLHCTIEGHIERISCIAWSKDSQVVATGSRNLRLFDVTTKEWLRTIVEEYPPLRALSWSPNGALLASASRSGVCLWEPQTGGLKRRLTGFAGIVDCLSWSPDSRVIASSSQNQVWLWDTLSGKVIRKLSGHSRAVLSLAWSPDGQILSSGSEDTTISLWDTKNWRQFAILEGHTAEVKGLSFSHDGVLLASESRDVRLWRCDDWDQIAVLKVPEPENWSSGLSFRPKSESLATLGPGTRSIRLWNLDLATLIGAASASSSVRYTNAKVVLVGDTGVGKSGLGLVLSDPPFRATDSTHNRKVWTFDNKDVAVAGGRTETRETLLWDMAGQPGYRLIHQLHLNEVAVALIVFDARSETDPFAGVRHWERALRQAQRTQEGSAPPLRKILVAARTDRGGIGVSRQRISKLMKDLSIDAYFETSAKEGKNIIELATAIREAIPWNLLPRVSSTDLFRRIKNFLVAEKRAGRLLTKDDDLYRAFLLSEPMPKTREVHEHSLRSVLGELNRGT